MIPEFPKFKSIELSNKEEIEKFTAEFPPYSDFNFTNLWSWDISRKMKISQLDKNIVVLFSDYISGRYFLSFIGKNNIPETVKKLTKYSEKHYQTKSLKLISKEVIELLSKKEYKTTPDRDSFDYIYTVDNLANMNNWRNSKHSKNIKKFIKANPVFLIKESSVSKISKDEYKEMFKRWAKNKKILDCFELNEYKAFERLLQIENDNLRAVSLYLNEVLVGFTVYEKVSNDYAISHFAKADISHHSLIYDILNWEEAKILQKKGIKYFNYELDLGIIGLRHSKESYRPVFFLEKFIINN